MPVQKSLETYGMHHLYPYFMCVCLLFFIPFSIDINSRSLFELNLFAPRYQRNSISFILLFCWQETKSKFQVTVTILIEELGVFQFPKEHVILCSYAVMGSEVKLHPLVRLKFQKVWGMEEPLNFL